ncbi:hypothetical protein [Prevotella sp.]|uniref:hypothetical protein n=1 Tax=Prevotella sp. TaxID=59823 RepID=UPI003AF4EB66
MAVPTTLGTFYIGGELKPSVRTPQIVLILSVSDGLLRKAGLWQKPDSTIGKTYKNTRGVKTNKMRRKG